MLDEIVTEYGFDKLNALTQYPSILSFHKLNDEGKAINELASADYQPTPPRPEKMNVIIQEIIDGEIIRIIVLDNDYFIGNKNEIIHAKGDRIVLDSMIIPVYKSLSNFFQANLSSNERMMILYGVLYGKGIKGHDRYIQNDDSDEELIKCLLVDGFTIKIQDVIGLFKDNSVSFIENWVNTLHQPFWALSTLNKFCNACNVNQLSNLGEVTTLNKIPQDINEMKQWIKLYKTSSLTLTNTKTDKKNNNDKKNLQDILQEIESSPVNINAISKNDDIDDLFNLTSNKALSKFNKSKGVIIRSIDRTYIRKIKFDDYL